MKKLISLAILTLIGNPGFATVPAPLTTGLRCSIDVLDAKSNEEMSTIDVYAVDLARRLTSLVVKHGSEPPITLVGPGTKLHYVVANQMNDSKQTKILMVDPMAKGAGGKPATASDLMVFKLKVTYQEDDKGEAVYGGSIFYSLPGSNGTVAANGALNPCKCINSRGKEIACQKLASRGDDKQNSGGAGTSTGGAGGVVGPISTEPVTTPVSTDHNEEVKNRLEIDTYLTKRSSPNIYTPIHPNSNFNDFPGGQNFRTVIPGVLYRGGSGAMEGLNEDEIQRLCTEGFSGADFAYTGGKFGLKSCPRVDPESPVLPNKPNSYEYKYVNANNADSIYQFMAQISNAVRAGKGPMYVHCWGGHHESGQMSAYALELFCGFTSAQAITYWNRNSNGDRGKICDAISQRLVWFSNIRNQERFEQLRQATDLSGICPEPPPLQPNVQSDPCEHVR